MASPIISWVCFYCPTAWPGLLLIYYTPVLGFLVLLPGLVCSSSIMFYAGVRCPAAWSSPIFSQYSPVLGFPVLLLGLVHSSSSMPYAGVLCPSAWSTLHPICSCDMVHGSAAWSRPNFSQYTPVLGFPVLLPGLVRYLSSMQCGGVHDFAAWSGSLFIQYALMLGSCCLA